MKRSGYVTTNAVAVAAFATAVALLALPRADAAAPTAPPRPTGEPRILGMPTVGSTLTATTGSWAGTQPFTFSYQWLRCPRDGGAPDGSNCGVIPNATQSAYEVRPADVGFRLRVRVTARNADGSASSTSNATEIVTRGATRPQNTSPPTISGTPTVGQTLTANPGAWSGGGQITFAYQWRRCDANGGSCANIGGATARTYTLTGADEGNTVRVRVTASNARGSTNATSAPSAVVRAAPVPGPAGCPSGSGTVAVDQLAAPARLTADGLRASPRIVRLSTGRIIVQVHVSACGGRPVQGALVYVATVPFNQFAVPPETATGANGWAELSMQRLRGFPAARRQQLLVMFIRARKPGENVLGGVSTRRLVAIPVTLRR